MADHLQPMNWLAILQRWQVLPPEQRRAQVPASVAASMAFEGEPVSLEHLEELHRIATPASPKRAVESSATPSYPAAGLTGSRPRGIHCRRSVRRQPAR